MWSHINTTLKHVESEKQKNKKQKKERKEEELIWESLHKITQTGHEEERRREKGTSTEEISTCIEYCSVDIRCPLSRTTKPKKQLKP